MNATNIPLGNAMHIMCSDIRKQVNDNPDIDHCHLCNIIAEKYSLWYNNMFPTWLSRVIEGIMNDVSTGTDETL